jgi:hypothetical protein
MRRGERKEEKGGGGGGCSRRSFNCVLFFIDFELSSSPFGGKDTVLNRQLEPE